jgi:fatty-acyl-CoA synthase
MQDVPLTTTLILERGERYWGTRTVTTRTTTGTERTTFADVAREARLIGGALDALGISSDGRVATYGWNTAHHQALYFGIPGTGRVMHTGNIRYTPEQLAYTFGLAEDEAVFVDRSLLGALARDLAALTTVRHIVVMDDGAETELPDDPRVVLLDDLLADADEIDLRDRVQDENAAAAICFTSGTTGNPKGVVYSHRSTWLHTNAVLTTGVFALTDADRLMPVVPMFHANAWGLSYAAFLAGSSLVMPGPDLSPSALLDLIESERVTVTGGVPTIWLGMLPLLEGRDVSSLRTVIGGGAAVPAALSEGWRRATGIPILHAWGMTEISPVGAVGMTRSEVAELSEQEQIDVRAAIGIAPSGVEMRIVDPETRIELPWDGEAVGELECRGPWIARQYFGAEGPDEQFTDDGWLRTGDVATISPLGYARLVDRTKDLIKSGGEWISSVELENLIMSHPKVAEAAVIATPHPHWGERPLACVVARPARELQPEEVLAFLRDLLPSWKVPDRVVLLPEIPKTSVGKFSKRELRERYATVG